MHEHGVGALIVVDERFATMGILSDRDIAMRVVASRRDPATTTVAGIMTPWPTTILLDTSVETALAEMRMGRMRRLPVLDGVGTLIGIVTLDDILTLLAEEFSLVGELLEREAPHEA
jgi:CBS domain-containing protein